jgi:membrane associated rhomboid family serine protease
MNLDQKLAIIYTTLGILAGFISTLFSSLQFALIIPVVIYLISFIFLVRFCKHKKISWLIFNTIFVFFLIWLMVWIFTCNLGDNKLCSREVITPTS